jgi:hypothetical protein
MSETGTMVYMVVAEYGPGEFLIDISLLVDAAGRPHKHNALRPIGIFKPLEPGGCIIHSYVPSGFLKRPFPAYQGFGQTVFMLNKLVDLPSFDTETPFIGGTGFQR